MPRFPGKTAAAKDEFGPSTIRSWIGGDLARRRPQGRSPFEVVIAPSGLSTRDEMDPGDIVADRFEVEQIAGAGGMGTVYRARDRVRAGPWRSRS